MSDHYSETITLHDGRTLVIDLYKITQREYRTLLDANTTAEQQDVIVAKAAGLTGDELADLPKPDWKLVVETFFGLIRRPLAETPSPAPATTS